MAAELGLYRGPGNRDPMRKRDAKAISIASAVKYGSHATVFPTIALHLSKAYARANAAMHLCGIVWQIWERSQLRKTNVLQAVRRYGAGRDVVDRACYLRVAKYSIQYPHRCVLAVQYRERELSKSSPSMILTSQCQIR